MTKQLACANIKVSQDERKRERIPPFSFDIELVAAYSDLEELQRLRNWLGHVKAAGGDLFQEGNEMPAEAGLTACREYGKSVAAF